MTGPAEPRFGDADAREVEGLQRELAAQHGRRLALERRVRDLMEQVEDLRDAQHRGPRDDGRARFEARIAELSRDLETARDESTELAAERAAHLIRLRELEERQDFDKRRLDAAGRARDAVARERDTVVARHAELEQHQEALSKQLSARTAEIEELRRANASLEARVLELGVAADAADKILGERDERLREAAAHHLALIQEKGDLDRALAVAAAQREQFASLVEEREGRIAEMQMRLDEARTEAAARIATTEQELEQLRAERAATVAEFEREMDALGKQHEVTVAELEHDLGRAIIERDSVAAQLGEQTAAFEALVEAHAVLERRSDSSDAALKTANDQLGRLAPELESVRSHAHDLRETLAGAQEELTTLRSRVGPLRAERHRLAVSLVRTQAALTERTEQLQSLLGSTSQRAARVVEMVRRRVLVAVALVLVAAGAVVGATVQGGVTAAAVSVAIVIAAAGAALSVGWHRTSGQPQPPRLSAPLPAVQTIEVAPRAIEWDTASDTSLIPSESVPGVTPPSRPAQVIVASRLVPAPSGGTQADLERQRWLSGARMNGLRSLRVAGILDEMSRACFAPECMLMSEFGLEDWEERLEADPPHILLVESAWSGNNGGWQYGVASYPHPHYRGVPYLRALIEWCRKREIPTVFWNKEDPVHFDRFKEAAALFDHVFTTDSNCIPAYEALGGRHVKSVVSLPFAAQPLLHNPITVVEERSREPVFAGTYYRNRHIDRQASLEMILDAARPFGLIIYDRTHGTKSEDYGFPERFQPHIKGRLPYQQVIDVYKSHRLFLNVNSVVDSPTMFSRRVFELLACGTAVISTESVGIEAVFGDLVPIVKTSDQATDAIRRVLEDDAYFADVSLRARRLVLSHHTYRERLAAVAETVGFDLGKPVDEETAVLVLAENASELGGAVEAIVRQAMRPDEVLVGLREGVAADRTLEPLREALGEGRVRIVTQAAGSVAERYRELALLAASGWVAPIDAAALYGPDHLRDLQACARFCQADAVGTPVGEPLRHQYVQALQPLSALVRRESVAAYGWPSAAEESQRWFARGLRFYAGEGGSFTGPASEAVPSKRSAGGDRGLHSR